LTFNALLLMIFLLYYVSLYNMVAKFYCQDYVFYAHILSTLTSALNALHRLIKIVLVHVTLKIIILLSLTYLRTSRS
jgi:hypothetical protein